MSYPNIEAIAEGRISGQFRRWIQINPEAIAILKELSALKADNELLLTDNTRLAERGKHYRDQVERTEAELDAAQAKLAVPVPEDVRDTISYLRGNPDCPGSSDERDIADMLTALARDNAALRTKVESLELKRSERALDKMAENAKELGLDYDAMKPDGPLTKAGTTYQLRMIGINFSIQWNFLKNWLSKHV